MTVEVPLVEGSYVKYEPEKKNPVDENSVSQNIYVNPAFLKASDNNPGTELLPLKSLLAAANIVNKNIQNNIGTRVILYPGIYRESIEIINKVKENAPVIFEAKEAGSVIISGSDLWQNWQQYPANKNIYTHSWPYDWGVAYNPWPDRIEISEIARRKEIIFINGKLLRQKLSLNELSPGSFYVSEETDTAFIYPPLETDVENSQIEVGTRNRLIFTKGLNNLVLRGLKFQHSNDYRREAVAILRGKNVLVENCKFLWNNSDGLTIAQSENITVRKVTANHNGIRGMSANRLQNAYYEDVESSYNNWRGDWGGFYSWDPGQKFLFTRNLTFRRYKAVGNMAAGLWLDTDNSGVWIDDSLICDNFHTGLYIEASHHILVTNSKICHNRANPESRYHHPGILGSTSSDVTLENNVICGNDRSQIKVQVVKPYGGRVIPNWETDKEYALTSQQWVLKNNIIVGEKADQMLIFFEPNGQGFIDNLLSDGNIWYNPENRQVFQVGVRKRNREDFNKWQKLTGQEQKSVFASPGQNYSCGES
ncbi:MAG: right-handed parallel beta-helix repeat-containing protein [Cyanobacteriota bacterium]|nr:right-handed parallel beta-helix repeat-containing protein [Cyanobacteriota bacterium]